MSNLNQERKIDSGSIIIAIVFFVFLVGVPFALGIIGIIQQMKAQSFKEVEAIVISTKIDKRLSGTGGKNSPSRFNYVPKITYKYTVGGVEYTSDKYHSLDRGKSEKWARSIIDKYQKGVKYTAYYNPDDHTQSVLIKDVNLLACFISISIGIIFLVIGVWVIAKIRSPSTSRHQ